MITSIVELAFLCLQQNKEMRPSMEVILEKLRGIESGEWKPKNLNNDDDLKSMPPAASSPHCE
ncbi:hypothetical protein Patl1_15125 [Pistacia atlantica]|uniref:Uncharacterized protein n=1 Tax=Pistacia atlantica TaxID=434234 RepID=A0ACC1B757_9ROSI|nr:hypothetical protein Patl1_15125 [Pistacia atlantica]